MASTSREIAKLRAEMNERMSEQQKKLDSLAEEYGVKTNADRVNVTPEQVIILRDVLEDFTESQGNATISQLRMWVQENDDLNSDEKIAVQTVIEDLTQAAPEDWRVEGEFAQWLDRKVEEAETINVKIPVAGRTNEAVETAIRRPLESETVIEEIEIPAAGRNNDRTATIQKEVPVNSGLKEYEEWRERELEMKVEMEEERINLRREAHERFYGTGDSEREVDSENIPAAGRSNWEKQQESDD